MAKKIKLGDYNRLRIVKKVDFGLYLDGGDEGEILLPSNTQIGRASCRERV